MSDMSITRALDTDQYIVRMVFDRIERGTIVEIADAVPRLVAEQYARDNMQAIMDKVNANEVASCIAAAVAQKVADAYAAKDKDA